MIIARIRIEQVSDQPGQSGHCPCTVRLQWSGEREPSTEAERHYYNGLRQALLDYLEKEKLKVS